MVLRVAKLRSCRWGSCLTWLVLGTCLACLTCLAYLAVLISDSGSRRSAEEALGGEVTRPPEALPTHDPLYPKVPQSLFDHIYYSSYDGRSVYDNQDFTGGTTKRSARRLETRMFDQVRDKVIQYLADLNLTKYTRNQCSDIRYRTVPTMGMEVDVLCRHPSSSEMDRVTLDLPLRPPRIVYHQHHTATTTSITSTDNKTATNTAAKIASSSATKTATKNVTNTATNDTSVTNINIVVPLTGRTAALKLFLDNLRRVMKGNNSFPLGLTLAYFEDGESEAARATLEAAAADTPGLHTHFLLLNRQNFSRSLALKTGVEQSVIQAAVVFLCDVDVLFTLDFLYRCLITPVRDKQVFFPTVFSLYNPSLGSALQGTQNPPTLNIADESGYWRVWGHGMSCLYKSDFQRINGFDPQRSGWGGEDLNFLSKTSGMKYKIVRSLEPGIFHNYHPKNCSLVGKGQSWPCSKVRAKSEASSLTYGLWFFRQNYSSSSWGILREKERWEERWREEEERARQAELMLEGNSPGLQQRALGVMLLLNLALTFILVWRNMKCRSIVRVEH